MSIQKIRFIPIVLLMLIGFAACQDDTPVNPVKWTQLTDLSKFGGKARASATCFVIGKKAYVCCGRSGWRDGFLKEVWEYDSETDTWTRKRDFPGPARVKAVAGVIGTKAYMGMGAVGAYEPKNLFKDFWEYDSQTDTWTQKAAFPDSASNDLFAAVVDGAFYTVAGFDGITRKYTCYKYDPQINVWTKLHDSPFSYSNRAGFSLGNCFYVGTGFRGSNMSTIFRYRPADGQWRKVANVPDGRMLSNGLAIGNKGYILLGRYWNGYLNNGRLLADVVEYDPATDAWTKRGNFAGGARQNAVVFQIDGTGYIAMGEDDTNRKSDVWSFKP